MRNCVKGVTALGRLRRTALEESRERLVRSQSWKGVSQVELTGGREDAGNGEAGTPISVRVDALGADEVSCWRAGGLGRGLA